MNDPNPNEAPVLHPAVSAAQDAVRLAAARDLTDPLNDRRLRKAMKALQVVREAFATSADEFDLATEAGVPTHSGLSPLAYPVLDATDDLMPLLGTGFARQQRPNAPETFASRVLREMLTVVPEFLAQGRIRVEADRARSVSALAFDVAEATKRGDTVTADLLRKELARLVETAPEPTSGAVALGAYKNLDELPPETRLSACAVVGIAQGALKNDPETVQELTAAVAVLAI